MKDATSIPQARRAPGRPSRQVVIAGLSLWSLAGLAIPVFADDRDSQTTAGATECEASHSTTLFGPPPAPFDPISGRDLRNWPPSPGVDFLHMALDLTILDMNTPKMQGVQTMAVRALNRPVATISLDAHLLDVKSVKVGGHWAVFKNDGQHLVINFDPPLSPDRPIEIVTTYEVTDPPRGLFWTLESPDWPGRPPQIHTQGQPQTNSYWFPCHDFPNERQTSELSVTVPVGYTVCSNGRLVEHNKRVLERPDGLGGTNLEAYDKFTWVQDKPHVSYLVTMVVGKFDVVDVGTPATPMPVYAPLGRGHDVRATFGRTSKMVDLFAKLTGQTYPWDKYAQLVVWNFGAGGMENTSATSLYDTAILDAKSLVDHDLDGLISHELAHQWFGDLITCNSWEHIWLNEGWATYSSHLWFEQRDGRTAYESGIRDNFDGVIGADKGSLPETPGMASKAYGDPWEPFRRPANPYGKGASILHMLRTRLGDGPFFDGLKLYFDRNRLKTAETGDFRKALEDASGDSLELFFNQWVFRPNVPRVKLDVAWKADTKSLELHGMQTQKIDALNPAFEFRLPIWAHTAGSNSWTKAVMLFDGKDTTTTLSIDTDPDAIAIDPELTVIAEVNCGHPAASSLALATMGPTLNARLQGLRGMAKSSSSDAEQLATAAIVRNESEPVAIRRAAVDVLAKAGNRDLILIAGERPKAWQVREAVLRALSEKSTVKAGASIATRERAASLLEQAWTKDQSIRVKCAALRGLATMGLGSSMSLIEVAAGTDSQDDELRQAALDAVVTLDRREGLAVAVEMVKPGHLSRTRPAAINAVDKLARHNPSLALNTIASAIDDKEMRARQAAGQALVDLGDARGIDVLARRAKVARDPYEQAQAREWLSALQTKLATPAK